MSDRENTEPPDPSRGLTRPDQDRTFLVPDEKAVLMIEACANEIFKATTIPEVQKTITQAEAVAAMVRATEASERVRKDASFLVIRAERRLGEITMQINRIPPGRKLASRLPEVSKQKFLLENGIKPRRYMRAEQLARTPEKTFEKALETASRPNVRNVLNVLGLEKHDRVARWAHVRIAEDAVSLLDSCCKANRAPRRDEVNRLQLRLMALNVTGDAS